ncbi:hypothetical protein EVAR_88582_1 [Eumeta japonica]|uniref:Uncharacterized protein n=1 Tax=Eumeta variegata TaxID=151549 RepID=A0A4C1Y923_EUMVA|nr:hypothetical protein EVAR_88582_1 [Eumeta japonica]
MRIGDLPTWITGKVAMSFSTASTSGSWSPYSSCWEIRSWNFSRFEIGSKNRIENESRIRIESGKLRTGPESKTNVGLGSKSKDEEVNSMPVLAKLRALTR